MPVTYARLGRAVTSPRVYVRRPLTTRLLDGCFVDLGGPITRDHPCWVWTAAERCGGYGTIGRGGRGGGTASAHRVAYELWFGAIPAGLDIDHLCRRPACCNPFHLEAVTRSVNLRRGKHGGGPQRGYRHRPETIEKLQAAARRRREAAGVPWSAEWRAS